MYDDLLVATTLTGEPLGYKGETFKESVNPAMMQPRTQRDPPQTLLRLKQGADSDFLYYVHTIYDISILCRPPPTWRMC